MQEHSRFVKMKERLFLLGERLDEAEARAASRLELLRRYEWIQVSPDLMRLYSGLIYFCPECRMVQEQGHADDCELAEELGDD